ncbi:MAG: MBOAT family protein [Bacteroidaceae bacterium]|nr:MBOAT family protein [Bacteroidaceae bacterium]
MIFNSLQFMLFLPIVFAAYWSVKFSRRLQNFLVIVASYVFYGWWDWRFLILIAFTSVCSYSASLLISDLQEKEKKTSAKWVSGVNIAINLLILGVFKYYNFFADSFSSLLHTFGVEADFVTLHVVLPVGISFYTFQALSYSIDVYRGSIPATRDLPAFLAFISFFPQLVAGPIERATNLLPQFLKDRRFDYGMAADGTRQMLWGFFKKMLVADNCAVVANHIFGTYETQNSVQLIGGALMFTFQIYGDFSGYSDIAIGCAKIFGIRLKRNFDVPYFSRNVAEFWKRWHISLNTWFVDYIYIPLGGSRRGTTRTFVNTMVIFAVSGLWHGANWTFVAWGLYHGLLFLPLILLGSTKKYAKSAATIAELPQMLLTFALVVIGWIFFRADSISQAFDYMVRICDPSLLPTGAKGLGQFIKPAYWIVAMLAVEWLTRRSAHNFRLFDGELCVPSAVSGVWGRLSGNAVFRYALYLVFIMTILICGGQQTAFIYFQF